MSAKTTKRRLERLERLMQDKDNLENLGLGTRVLNPLKRVGYTKITEIVETIKTRPDTLYIYTHSFGKKAFDELVYRLFVNWKIDENEYISLIEGCAVYFEYTYVMKLKSNGLWSVPIPYRVVP